MGENDELDIDQRKAYVTSVMIDHTPANQEGNSYDRCALCSYTRFPCTCYDMAEIALEALEALHVT